MSLFTNTRVGPGLDRPYHNIVDIKQSAPDLKIPLPNFASETNTASIQSSCQIAVLSNSNAAQTPAVSEMPEVKKVMDKLRPLLEQVLEEFGHMPQNTQEQEQFVKKNYGIIQEWTDKNIDDLHHLQSILNPPASSHRYGRNLIMSLPEKNIYVFLHLLNPKMETPKHWHSEKGLPALAFAASLKEGVTETKWEEQEGPLLSDGRKVIQFKYADTHACPPNTLAAIPGNYGAHKITNTTEKTVGLFEIYFEPEPLDNLDLPVSVLGSQEDHIIDTVPCAWLPDRNLQNTAERFKWPLVDLPFSSLSFDPESSFFTVVNGETVYIPQNQLKGLMSTESKLFSGPGKRFLATNLKNTN